MISMSGADVPAMRHDGAQHSSTATRPLDVRLVAMGTHGDVMPYLALGRELRARGHDVAVIANGYHADLVRRASLDFIEAGTAEVYREFVDHPDAFHPRRGARLLAQMVKLYTEGIYEHLAATHEPGRTVTVGPFVAFPARIAQEKLGVPMATVNIYPVWLFSADDPPVFIPQMSWLKRAPRWCRRLGNHLFSRHMERTFGEPVREFREKLGLPPWENFVAWSNSPAAGVGLFPEWFAPRQADWPPHFRHSQFPLYDEGQPLPEEVEAFLADGPPPVVFTPGSAQARATPFIRAAADACRRLGRRGIILSNFGEKIGELPAGVIQLGFVPLGPLLGRTAGIVHHGGIGTLSQALSAGVPQVVTPLSVDQPDNAVRLVDMGVARRVNMQGISGRRLAAALDHVLNSADVAAACRRTAALFPKKPGLHVACEAIEGLIP